MRSNGQACQPAHEAPAHGRVNCALLSQTSVSSGQSVVSNVLVSIRVHSWLISADMAAADDRRMSTRATGVVGLAVLSSRVLGLIRETIFAGLFGAGRNLDAFLMAF